MLRCDHQDADAVDMVPYGASRWSLGNERDFGLGANADASGPWAKYLAVRPVGGTNSGAVSTLTAAAGCTDAHAEGP